MTSFFLFVTLGWGLFYLNELLLYPQVYVRPLAPLLFYVALKDSLAQALTLAVILGLLQDSYALGPFGVHLLGSLIIVGVACLARRTFIMKNALSLIMAMLAALIIQELGVRITLTVLGSRDILFADLSLARGLELLVTAVLTPVFFGLIRALERRLGSLGRARRQETASW